MAYSILSNSGNIGFIMWIGLQFEGYLHIVKPFYYFPSPLMEAVKLILP